MTGLAKLLVTSRIQLSFCLTLVFATRLLVAVPAQAQTPFYDPPKSMLDGHPGTLVRQEPIDGAPLGAATYRVIYRSTGLKNEPIFVSGVVIVPQGVPPPGGRPIVAWAHPTSGVTPRCAPSLAIFLFQQIQGLRSFLERGLCCRGDRLSRARYAGAASVSGRRQRSARGDRTRSVSRRRCRAPAAANASPSGDTHRVARHRFSPA